VYPQRLTLKGSAWHVVKPFFYLDDLHWQRHDHNHNEGDQKLNDASHIHSLALFGLMTVGISVGDLR
jgi:hypothetical protein